MAIQFLDVSGTKKVLFVGTSIAMDPACCCGIPGGCCSWLSEEFDIDLTGRPFTGTACEGHYIIGNFETDWLYGCLNCNNKWHDTFAIPATGGTLEITLEYWGGCDGVGWWLRVEEFNSFGTWLATARWTNTGGGGDCGDEGGGQLTMNDYSAGGGPGGSCIPKYPTFLDDAVVAAL